MPAEGDPVPVVTLVARAEEQLPGDDRVPVAQVVFTAVARVGVFGLAVGAPPRGDIVGHPHAIVVEPIDRREPVQHIEELVEVLREALLELGELARVTWVDQTRGTRITDPLGPRESDRPMLGRSGEQSASVLVLLPVETEDHLVRLGQAAGIEDAILEGRVRAALGLEIPVVFAPVLLQKVKAEVQIVAAFA